MGLNFEGPLIFRFFSVINTTVLQGLQLVEFENEEPLNMEEPRIQRNPDTEG